MELSHRDLDDLVEAVTCWVGEQPSRMVGTEEFERMRELLVRLKVRRLTTKDLTREQMGD